MNTQFSTLLTSRSLAAWIGALVAMVSLAAYAVTAFNTDITNEALVNYEDENGNTYSASSNEAKIKVGQIFDAEIYSDEVTTGAPGSTVYTSHYLTNNGNGSDTYTITFDGDTLEDGVTGGAGGASDDTAVIVAFVDANGNGQPDSGETQLTSGDTVTVAAGDTLAIVMGTPIPVSAGDGDSYGLYLQAVSTGSPGDLPVDTTLDGGTAADTGVLGATEDDADGTVQARVDVTTDAVLVTTKSQVYDAVNNRLTYTLTVKNNGGVDATSVEIFDAIPDGTEFFSFDSANGVLTANGDSYVIDSNGDGAVTAGDNGAGTGAIGSDYATEDDLAEVDEPTGVDMDGDGVTGETAIAGLLVTDAVLAPNTTVSLVYTVSITSTTAYDDINNIFCAQGDLDGDTVADAAECSNQTLYTIPPAYGVSLDDTHGTTTGVGDDQDTAGVDGNGADDDDQYRDSASTGETVVFRNTVTNNGNVSDVFDLSTAIGTFPTGTTFTYYDATNSALLSGAQVGPIAAGGSIDIVVRAKLPTSITAPAATAGQPAGTLMVDSDGVYFLDQDGDGVYDDDGTEGFTATTTATSQGDSSESDTKTETLGQILGARVDLANNAFDTTGATVDTFDDLGDTENYQATTATANQTTVATVGDVYTGDEAGVITTVSGVVVGGTATYQLFIANESGSSIAFDLSASIAGAGSTSTWTTQFYAGSTATGAPVTSTVAIPAGEQREYTAVVTVGSTAATAIEGDYTVTFTVADTSTGSITDSKLDGLQIAAQCTLSVSAALSNQIQPGGTVDFLHTLTNDANSTQTFALSSAMNSAAAATDGWTTNLYVTTIVLGSPVVVALSSLSDGDPVRIYDATGSATTVNIAAGEISLNAGETLNFRNRVFAPASAGDGDLETSTITATGECGVATAADDAEVILGQVRLTKEVALDVDCDCNSNGLTFEEISSSTVAPGQCVIWQLTAENQGTADADNVSVVDEITPYSVTATSGVWGAANPSGVADPGLAAGDVLKSCVSNSDATGAGAAQNAAGCTAAGTGAAGDAVTITDATATGTNTANITGSVITFFLGTGATDTAGGTLSPGDTAVGEFCVQVN